MGPKTNPSINLRAAPITRDSGRPPQPAPPPRPAAPALASTASDALRARSSCALQFMEKRISLACWARPAPPRGGGCARPPPPPAASGRALSVKCTRVDVPRGVVRSSDPQCSSSARASVSDILSQPQDSSQHTNYTGPAQELPDFTLAVLAATSSVWLLPATLLTYLQTSDGNKDAVTCRRRRRRSDLATSNHHADSGRNCGAGRARCLAREQSRHCVATDNTDSAEQEQ
ncbi:unnamed protein product [Spodoptera exigua]|nr:unnamed protein product [Spodoptera exigua]